MTEYMKHRRSVRWAAKLLATAIWSARRLPIVGQTDSAKLLSSEDRNEPFWQTRVEMEKSECVDFFSLFGLTESVLDRGDILDLGCGYGGNVLLWAKRHPQSCFTGIEPAANTIRVANEAKHALGVPNARFVTGVGEAMAFPNESFDLVMTFDVMEHVEDPRKVLREVARVLKPGGVYLGAFPPYYGPMSHHLTYVTKLPFLHYVSRPELLVDAVNHLVDSGRLKVPRQPEPKQGVWGRTVLPSLNGTTIRDWNALSQEVEREHPVRLENEFVPFARRLPMIGRITSALQRRFPGTDVFCGHIVTRMEKLG